MVKIYQWQLVRYFDNNFSLKSHEVEAKETPKGYRALKENFIGYRVAIKKDCLDKVFVSPMGTFIYSSLENNVEVAINALKEHYTIYAEKKIADYERMIKVHEERMLIVNGLTVDTDGVYRNG